MSWILWICSPLCQEVWLLRLLPVDWRMPLPPEYSDTQSGNMVTSYLEVHLLFAFQKKGINNIYIYIYSRCLFLVTEDGNIHCYRHFISLTIFKRHMKGLVHSCLPRSVSIRSMQPSCELAEREEDACVQNSGASSRAQSAS